MKLKRVKFMIATATAVLMAFPALAADKGNVVAEMTSQKVVKSANAKDRFESAATAKPGDIIEYRAIYLNRGKETASNVLATIPVPQGTEFIPGSATPSHVTASLNGKDFSPVPLKRKVQLPSGKTELREVPYGEYRFIRWDLKTLAPGQSAPVLMRVKISTTSVNETASPHK